MFSASAVLPIDGPPGQDEQVAAVQAAGHFVELGEAGADSLDALAGIEKGVDAAFVVLQNLLRVAAGPLSPARRPA